MKSDIPILYIEAKDIGVSLDKIEKSEQMDRYFGYANLVLTDYIEFRFYRNGFRYQEPIKIAEYDLKNRTISPLPENFEFAAKTPNLKTEIVNEIEKIVGKVTPEDILDYIYAVLHSPSYREKYKEFLKIDFPRVPYPKDKTAFNKLVKLGTELRHLHLIESPKVNKLITTYPAPGNNEVEKPRFDSAQRDTGKV